MGGGADTSGHALATWSGAITVSIDAAFWQACRTHQLLLCPCSSSTALGSGRTQPMSVHRMQDCRYCSGGARGGAGHRCLATLLHACTHLALPQAMQAMKVWRSDTSCKV